jgi:transcriptional regulator with XRE-family HTH domain
MEKKIVNSSFEKRRLSIPYRTRRFVELSTFFSLRVREVLQAKNMDQAGLAAKMGKEQSEISRMLTGTHNLTLKSISAIEEAIEARILIVEGAKLEAIDSPTVTVEIAPRPYHHEQKMTQAMVDKCFKGTRFDKEKGTHSLKLEWKHELAPVRYSR